MKNKIQYHFHQSYTALSSDQNESSKPYSYVK